nr:MAG TPA: hypothetical protein [Caudoviricetes sp.]
MFIPFKKNARGCGHLQPQGAHCCGGGRVGNY